MVFWGVRAMIQATVEEAQQRLPDLLGAVEAGEEVEIPRRTGGPIGWPQPGPDSRLLGCRRLANSKDNSSCPTILTSRSRSP